ncbi:hypothetical protein FBU31_006493, partial [Coemansia sp. 'formosensis']
FVSNHTRGALAELGIKMVNTSIYHLRSDMAEAYVNKFKTAIRRRVAEVGREGGWVRHIPFVIAADALTPLAADNTTPWARLHIREALQNAGEQIFHPDDDTNLGHLEAALHERTRELQLSSRRRAALHANRRNTRTPFEKGELVTLLALPIATNLAQRILPRQGPYRITERNGVNYWLEELTGEPLARPVHGERLAAFIMPSDADDDAAWRHGMEQGSTELSKEELSNAITTNP